MRIGLLGTGKMGTPMGLRLIAAGHELSVWNRSEGRAKPLIHEGAIAAGTPAEAELGAAAVMTMLADDEAYEHVLFGPNGLADALSPGGLHVSCSTISVALSERLTVEYARRGVDFVAAPVFGGPNLAEQGRLWVVAGGADRAVDRARPLLEAFSRGITAAGREPRLANGVKLGGSLFASAMIHATSEALVFAELEGVASETLFEAVNHAMFESRGYAAYVDMMLHGPEHVETSIEVAARDLRLVREAAGMGGIRLGLVERTAEIFAEARRSGLEGQEAATAVYRMTRRRQH